MNHYAKAIELVTTDLNWKEVCVRMAQKHPKAFVECCIDTTWQKECKELVDSGHKIDAIKLWREITGSSLREAKQQVESL